MTKLTMPLVTPITDYTLACDRLLDDCITRVALTKDELNIIKCLFSDFRHSPTCGSSRFQWSGGVSDASLQ